MKTKTTRTPKSQTFFLGLRLLKGEALTSLDAFNDLNILSMRAQARFDNLEKDFGWVFKDLIHKWRELPNGKRVMSYLLPKEHCTPANQLYWETHYYELLGNMRLEHKRKGQE